MTKKFIVVAGNIGVGKSTLVDLLCSRLGFQPFYEPVTENPYLADFYRQMESWSFHSQVFFLAHRLQLHQDVLRFPSSSIQDRSIYEDAEVFARNLFLQGHMSQRDFETYSTLYHSVTGMLPPPDLVIYLKANEDTLLKRISMRGREYERKISREYLSQLNGLYTQWIDDFTLCPVLTVPADNLDYVAQARHLELVAQKVEQKLTGKDEVVFSDLEVNGFK
jgi:deoxyadenosine/deoxycytidine kinase